MKLVDANILIYAVNSDAAHHRAAKSWLDNALSGGSAVGFCWPVMLAFLRLVTKRGLFPHPLSTEVAIEVLDGWLAQTPARVVAPRARHLEILAELLAGADSGGNQVNDAHLAALAIEHRAEVITFDRDFGRFPRLRWSVPD